MDWMSSPEAWVALLTLTVLEIVLGIDNIVFISIVTGRLPASQQAKARRVGLIGALLMRLALLGSLFWLSRLTTTLFTLYGEDFSLRDLILIGGGLFLLAKSTIEIHKSLEVHDAGPTVDTKAAFTSVIVQVMLLDIVFSLDSVITAIGMAEHVAVMAIAIVIAVAFMLAFVNEISDFIDRHPTVKMLALSFLLMIGLALVGDGPARRRLERVFRTNAVHFAGFLRGEELATAMASADVFVMPSTTETLGFVVLEAMSAGVPVVAASAGGLTDLVAHGETGLLYDPEDIAAAARTIRTVLDSRPLRIHLARLGRKAAENATWERETRALVAHYEAAIARARRSWIGRARGGASSGVERARR